MKWRLLPFAKHPAALNMAIDEAVAEAVKGSRSPATIRFYGWEPSAVSIGCFQALEDEVDVEECARRGVDVVRRRTGGGAVYHDGKGEITYSVIVPEEAMGGDITSSYKQVCGWVIEALTAIGLTSSYVPINDITVGGRKISGCAQTRREGVFLQHGTVLYSLDLSTMFSVLRVGKEKVADKGIASVQERVTAVSELSGVTMAELLRELQCSFLRWKEWYETPLSGDEMVRARELVVTRYGDPGWTRSR